MFDNSLESYSPIATCFAIDCNSKTLIMTCYHAVIFDDDDILDDLIICTTVNRRSDNKLEFENVIKVEVIAYDKDLDWAILKRKDLIPFTNFFKLRTKPVTNDLFIKKYFFAVSLFLETSLPILSCGSKDYQKVHSLSNHHVLLEHGDFAGTSGSPIIDTDSNLIGMHQESYSPIKGLSDVTTKSKRKIDQLMECANSASSSHAFLSYELMFCSVPSLINYLSNN